MVSFLDVYKSPIDITRGPLMDLRISYLQDNYAAISDAWGYFDRENDIESVRTKALERFGIGINKPVNNPSNDSTTKESYETYEREGNTSKIVNGHMEILSTSFGISVGRLRANLFNSPNQRYEYIDQSGKEIPEETINLIDTIKSNGNYSLALETADYISCTIGSSLVHCYYKGEKIKYSAILPQNIRVIYPSYITDKSVRGNDIPRPVDYQDLEDAYCVIIKLASDSTEYGSTDGSNQRWLAYFGRSYEYPDGRMVSYTGREYWPVPEPGTIGTIDYRHNESGNIANPLTYLANHGSPEQKQCASCEYPLVVINGGLRATPSELLPLSTSLYESSLEIEVAWSRVLRSGLKAARGKDIFTRDATATADLPKSLELISLKPGMQYQYNSMSSNFASTATLIEGIARTTAEGYDVPGYLVLSQISAPESGIALAIRTRPLIKARERRIKLNANVPNKLFDITRGLLTEYTGQVLIPGTIKQNWNPGMFEIPSNESEKIANIRQAQEGMVIDRIAAIREYHNLPSDTDAQALLERYLERDPGYKAATNEELARGGI